MKILKTPWRLSGLSGLLFVGLSFFASGINTLPPAYTMETAVYSQWFAQNGEWFRFGHVLAGLAFLLFYFPFYAGLCEKLKEAEGKPAIWTRVTWAGAIMSPAAGTIAGAFIMGLALLGPDVARNVARFGISANYYAYVVSGAYGGIAMIGAAVIILRTGVFGRWLGWTGLWTGIAAIASVGTLVENNPNGFFGTVNGLAWLIYFLWIAALSIVLIRIPREKTPTE
ncbi:MAG: hypothetical protein ACP5D8_09920 [Fidelibacterota bacterium]